MALKLIFFAFIFNTKLFAQPVNYQSLYTNATFSKTIDQNKPVGAIEGSADVTLTGGATYTIPIKVPPGTNGVEPKISIQYNSQAGNGIAGWGWNISGMSAIVRTPKSNFLDDEVQPVTYTSADVFSLDGNRLYANNGLYGANGTTYDKEQIDFATITSVGSIGSGPQYFTVKDRLGTTYEYGSTADARVLTDNGNEVMMWRLNRVIDVHGNYMEYQYLFNGRESLLYKIFYTGNVALGFGPYNELKFDYFSGRVDQNTMYEGGASLNSKSILKSITTSGEANQPFKKYAFEYGNDDLYSYLQEVREFGSDNFLSELNSTIFKYGEQPVEFAQSGITVNNVSSVFAQLPIVTGDYDGDGSSEIVVFSDVNTFKIYKKLPNGNYNFISSGALTSATGIVGQQAKIKHQKTWNLSSTQVSVIPATFHQSYHNNNLVSVDMNGDSKEDIVNISTVEDNQGLVSITQIGFLTYNSPNTQLFNYHLPLPPDGFININVSKDYFSMGDFDGDGRTDLILYVNKIVPFGNVGFIEVGKAFLYSAKNNFQPNVIKNLFLPGNPLPNNETTIRDNSMDPELTVVNFDGDNKNEVIVTEKINDLTYVFSLNFNNIGEPVAAFKEVKNGNVNVALKDETIYVGDFNGDGMTDLLTWDPVSGLNPDWYLHYSNGIGLNSQPFTFNNATFMDDAWIDNIGGEHPRDNIVIADFNGDGKSDILHGRNSLNNNISVCYEANYHIHMYYSTGTTFHITDYSFLNDVLQCPGNGQLPFPVNDFVPTDLNGDGRVEVIYKTKNGATPLAKLTFKEYGQEGLLQKIIDGNNNKTELRYDLISNGIPIHEIGGIAPVTANNFDVNYPLTSMQIPMNVVSLLNVPDGIGGNNITNFSYKEAVSQQAGRGFLGFLSVTATNSSLNTKEVYNMMPNLSRSLMWLKNQETHMLNSNTLVSKMIYNNSFMSYGGKLFQERNIDQITQNIIQGFAHKITNIGFDFWGNIIHSKSELFKTANSNIEESSVQTIYTTPGVVSSIPTLPSQIDVSQLRAGSAAISTQNTYEYFASGKLKKNIQFSNTVNPVTTSYTYNIAGLIKTKDISAINLPTRREILNYDNKYRFINNKSQTSSPAFFATNFNEYSVFEPLFGNLVSITSPDCKSQTFIYDAFGKIVASNHKVGTPDAYSITYNRGWYINGFTNTFETINDPGRPDMTTYFDKFGRKRLEVVKGFNNQDLIITYSYDARGNLATESNSFLAAETPIISTYTYDDLNRLASGANNLSTINTSYDFVNGDLKITTTNTTTNQSNSKLLDPSGKVISATDDGGTISFSYDSWGNEIKVKKGAQTFTQKTYDDYNRLVSSTDANAGTKTYIYNGLGEVTQETDAIGNTHTYVYDAAGRVKEKTGAEGVISYTYGNGVDLCKNGYLTHVANFNSVEENFDYDLYGRIVEKSTTVDANTYLHKYTYDQYDNNLSIQYPSGFKTYNEFTSDGYLSKVGYATAFNGQGQPTAFNYFYTANSFNGMGQAKSYLLGNGYTTTKDYQYGYLLKHEAKLGNSTLHNLEYTHNYANGNVVSRKDNFPIIPQTEVFTYDNLDRLTSSQVSIPNFTFDAGNYNYDGGNNYTKGNFTHNSIVGNFTYDGSKYHQLGFAQGIVNMPPGQVYIGPTIIPNTDVISDLQQQITYTPFQKTNKVIEDNREIQFTYDANYDRVKSVYTDFNTNETTTKYYLGNFETRTNPLGETFRIHYINGGDGLCAMVTMDDNAGTEFHYVYTDHLGSICKVTDPSGNVQALQSFDAWGRSRNPDDWSQIYPSLQTNNNLPEWLFRGYTSHEHIREFALIHMNARMYDPALGRLCGSDKFISDPFSSQAYNRYTYANNNPLKFTDPTGNNADWYKNGDGTSLIYFEGITSETYVSNDISYTRVGATGDNIWFKGQYFTLGGGSEGWGPSAWLKTVVKKDRNPYYHRMDAQDVKVWNETADGLTWMVKGPILAAPVVLGAVEMSASYLFYNLAYRALPHIPWIGTVGRTAAKLLDETGALSAEVAAAKVGTTVLGHYPEYVKLVESIGAKRFQIPTSVCNKMSAAEQWTANTKFLDRMILRGDNIRLATPLNQVKPGSFFQKELNYLFDKGYKVSSDGLWLTK